LAILFDYDPKRAAAMLDESLAIRDQMDPWYRAPLLATAVRQGHKELAKELIAAVRQTIGPDDPESTDDREKYKDLLLYRPLITAGDDVSIAEHLRLIDAMPHVFADRRFGERGNYTYSALLTHVVEVRPAEFVKRVLPLLESASLPERRVGADALGVGLKWCINFRAEAFAPERAEMLKAIRQQLDEIARMKPEAVPAYLQKIKLEQR
jgi:hypothetical protein